MKVGTVSPLTLWTASPRRRKGKTARIAHYLGVFLVCAGTMGAMGGAQEKRASKRNPLSEESALRGMAQYKQTCAMCHGSEARGAIGPNLIESSLVRHDEKGNLLADIIHNGRVPQGMPAFPQLTDPEVADLVVFLHAIVEASDNRASASGPARGLSAKRLLVGDVAAGKQFFNGAGKCASCHASTGDLQGVAKKYTALELEGRLLYPTLKFDTAVVTLPAEAPVKGRLLHLDQFYVAILDEGGNYRSWTLKDGVKVAVDDPLRAHRELLDRYQDKEIHDVFAYLETLQ